MSPAMSSLCTFAALSGAAGRAPGRRGSPQGGNKKRAVAQPLAAGAMTEAPAAAAAVVIAPPARPVVTTPRRREPGRDGRDSGASENVAWKSIRQERWEGTLELEGELPLWLVGDVHRSLLLITCTNLNLHMLFTTFCVVSS